MRVIGRTKPKGAMKVKGGRHGVLVAPVGVFRGRSLTVPMPPSGFPYQSEAIPKGVRGVRPFPPSSTSGLVGARRARRSELVLVGELACTQGGAGPGLAIRRRRANLLLASPALLGLSVGVPRVFGRTSGGGFIGSYPGSSGAVSPLDPALSGVA